MRSKASLRGAPRAGKIHSYFAKSRSVILPDTSERVFAPNDDGISIGEEKFFPDVGRPRRTPEHPKQNVQIAGAKSVQQRVVRTIQDMDKGGRI